MSYGRTTCKGKVIKESRSSTLTCKNSMHGLGWLQLYYLPLDECKVSVRCCHDVMKESSEFPAQTLLESTKDNVLMMA